MCLLIQNTQKYVQCLVLQSMPHAITVHLSCIVNFFITRNPKNKGIPKTIKQLLDTLPEGTMVVVDLWSHSWRKAGLSFAAVGTLDGIPWASLSSRARWRVFEKRNGLVVERYIQFEEAGDCLIGRVLAGLPLQSSEFAARPPMFDFADISDHDNIFLHQIRDVIFSTGNISSLPSSLEIRLYWKNWSTENRTSQIFGQIIQWST